MDGDGENSVVTTTEERFSTYMLPGPDMRKGNDVVAKAAEEISFGHKGKKFSPDEVRKSGGEFSGEVADFMEEQGLDHITFESGDEDCASPEDLRKLAGRDDK